MYNILLRIPNVFRIQRTSFFPHFYFTLFRVLAFSIKFITSGSKIVDADCVEHYDKPPKSILMKAPIESAFRSGVRRIAFSCQLL